MGQQRGNVETAIAAVCDCPGASDHTGFRVHDSLEVCARVRIDFDVRASFEVLYLSGWSPAATQQQPLRPGQATSRLADVLGVDEHGAGDVAVPHRTHPGGE